MKKAILGAIGIAAMLMLAGCKSQADKAIDTGKELTSAVKQIDTNDMLIAALGGDNSGKASYTINDVKLGKEYKAAKPDKVLSDMVKDINKETSKADKSSKGYSIKAWNNGVGQVFTLYTNDSKKLTVIDGYYIKDTGKKVDKKAAKSLKKGASSSKIVDKLGYPNINFNLSIMGEDMSVYGYGSGKKVSALIATANGKVASVSTKSQSIENAVGTGADSVK